MKVEIKGWSAGAMLGLFLAVAGTVAAQTPASTDSVTEQVRQLRDLVYKQQEQINQLQGQPKSGAPAGITEDQRQQILQLIKEELKDQKLPDWVSNLKITGDFRFRTEWIKQQQSVQDQINASGVGTAAAAAVRPERTRQRIRVRLGFFEKVNDEVDVGIQFGTGGGNNGGADPTHQNQTLGGDGFPGSEKKPVWIDLAYANYHPKYVPGLNVYMGRLPNPFLEVGDSELIWGAAIRFEGIAAKYQKTVAEGLTLFGNLGGFWLNETSTFGQPDTSLWGAQGYATLALPQLTKGAYATAGLSYYKYSNLANTPIGTTAAGTFPSSTGNTVAVTPAGVSVYDCNYGIINPFFEIGAEDPWLHKRLSFYGDFADNPLARTRIGAPVIGTATGSQRDDASCDFAWLLGVSYGMLKNPGDWKVSYNYRRVGADAVMAAFCDADSAGGGSDFQGSKFAVAYQVAKGWVASASYFHDQLTRQDIYRESPTYQRLELDFVFSF